MGSCPDGASGMVDCLVTVHSVVTGRCRHHPRNTQHLSVLALFRFYLIRTLVFTAAPLCRQLCVSVLVLGLDIGVSAPCLPPLMDTQVCGQIDTQSFCLLDTHHLSCLPSWMRGSGSGHQHGSGRRSRTLQNFTDKDWGKSWCVKVRMKSLKFQA